MEWIVDDALQSLIHQALLLGGLVAARLLPMVYLIPFLGGQVVPHTVKTGLCIALTILVYPAVAMDLGSLPASDLEYSFLLMKELFVGFVLGFVCALAFDALRMAGQIIDNTAGLTQATTLVPQLPDRISPTSNFLFQAGIVFFFAIGGHQLFLWALWQSFIIIPPTELLDPGDHIHHLALFVLELTSQTIALAVLLSFPVVAAVFLVNVVLALVNRAAPQINVFFLGMPLKAVLASGVLLLSIEVVLGTFSEAAAENLRALVYLLEGLRGDP